MKKENRSLSVQKATKNLAIWTMLWVSTMALSTFGPEFIWGKNLTLSVIAILINTLFGGLMIWANMKYIKVLDELQKKIQLDAMGIALGVGVVGGLSYSTLDITNVIPGDAEIGFLVILISVTYMAALFIGNKRYA